MKIIHIVLGRANPHRMNGVNRVVHNLATAQTLIGEDVEVWGISGSYLEKDEVERNYATSWFRPKGKFGLDKALIDAIRSVGAKAVCHLHGGFIPVFLTLSKHLKKERIPFFLTPHGTYTQGAMQGNSFVKKWYFEFIERKMLLRAQEVQCLGHAEESDLKAMAPKVRTRLIPNGQNFEELKTSSSKGDVSVFTIGFCGRISKWHKGLDILIESYLIYRKELGGTGRLSLIGDGEYITEMKKIAAESDYGSDVHFLGKLFGEAKIDELNKMSVFVHTSRNEGLPTAVIEATALGIPCIVSEMTSMDRYVESYKAGWGFKGLDPKHIASIFLEAEHLFHNSELVNLGRNALTMAKENFDWDVIARQTLKMYAVY